MSELRKIILIDPITGEEARVEPNGGLAVNVQDYTAPLVIAKFNKVHLETTLTAESLQGTRFITLSSVTGVVIGDYIILYNTTTNAFYVGEIVGIVGLVLELDRLLGYDFGIGTNVSVAVTNMAVNGSTSSPQIFGLRGDTSTHIQVTYDVTRILFTCLTSTEVNLAKFADLPKLKYGITLRKRNGYYDNLDNWKNNAEIAGSMMDWVPYSAQNANQGQHGFTARLTFLRLGGVVRLAPGEDLEVVVEEDLLTAGTINLYEIKAEGHVVAD